MNERRFIIIHKTNPGWERGEVPGPELIARVGKLMGDLSRAKILRAGEGLRASSQGVRLRRTKGSWPPSPSTRWTPWARLYIAAVETEEVDVREVADDEVSGPL